MSTAENKTKDLLAAAMAMKFSRIQREVPKERLGKVSARGRATKYIPSILTKTYDYINQCEDQFYNYQKGFGSTDTFERKVMADVPTLAGLALHLNVHRDTIHLWSKKHKDFSDALDTLMAAQQVRLINRGVSGDYNSQTVNRILAANHGMKDRVDVTPGTPPAPDAAGVTNLSTLTDEELLKLTTRGKG